MWTALRASLRERVATQRGDLGATVKAILLDPEARAADSATAASGEGHLMEPVLAILQLLRETGATVAAVNSLPGVSAGLAQELFNAPTVFNYYSPSYLTPGTPAVNAPEFEILSTSTAVSRANAISDLIYSRVNGVRLNLSAYDVLAAKPDSLLTQLNTDLMGGRMPQGMRKPITDYMALQKTAHDNQYWRRFIWWRVHGSTRCSSKKGA